MRGRALLPIIASLPAPIQEVVYYGAQKLVDFQDTAYAMTLFASCRGAARH